MRPVRPSLLAGAGLLSLLAGCAQPPPPAPPAPVAARAEEAVPDAPFCTRKAEHAAFDVAALKTRLMIAALSCGATERYNGFVTKNRGGLMAQEKMVGGYFSRHYGKSGQREQDDYITQLANLQAQRRTRDTDAFCRDTGALFDQAATIRTTDQLAALAETAHPAQPMRFSDCTETAEAPPAKAKRK